MNINIYNKFHNLIADISDNQIFQTRWDNFRSLLQGFKNNKQFKVNKKIILEICDENENRLTNFFGYFQVSSSSMSKISIGLLKKYIDNNDAIITIIINYLSDKDNIQHNLYYLLIEKFDKIFIF